ncbi:MAG: hypothetical protein NXI16_05440 [Alphaproteobacteria bacterium]|nr:hypothetical protein [Alphaproteobacteria bacterium]
MSLGLGSYEERRRKKTWGRVIKLVLFLGVVGGVAMFSYQVGVQDRNRNLADLVDEKNTLEAQVDQSGNAIAELRARVAEASAQAEIWERRYREDVPEGPLAELNRKAAARVAEGVPAERLAFVIDNVRAARDCETAETKRFLLQTPLTEGPATWVTFLDGRMTVTGRGDSATDDAGRPHAWFDPEKPVTLTVTEIGGIQSQATGPLPLHHSVVQGTVEHRFTMVAGEGRGFVEITADRCAFP